MNQIIVLVPSRGRPGRAAELYASFRETARIPATRLVFGVDHDDPTAPDYLKIAAPVQRYGWEVDKPVTVMLQGDDAGNLTRATNGLWRRFRDVPIIGTVNDDMLFRTAGWDRMVVDALADGPGIVYGNDLLQGERLPTSPFMSRVIPAALGWYALPSCEHLYIDDAWRDLGHGTGRIRYLEEMVIEHIHPGAGKADWDDNYERGNNAAVTAHDKAAYRTWLNGPLFQADVWAVRKALEAAA